MVGDFSHPISYPSQVRYFLEIAYNGQPYFGWQRQPKHISVQQVIEEKLSTKLQTPIQVVGCGRTDTGVHATSYFLHFDVEQELSKGFFHKMNTFLPKSIVILRAFEPKKANLHARFSAQKRTYTYKIFRHKNPFYFGQALYYRAPLDLDLLQEGAKMISQHQDFTTFSKSGNEVNHYLCDIYESFWRKEGDLLLYQVSANRFVRSMVRLIVGNLLQVGREVLTVAALSDRLTQKDRTIAFPPAAPDGLYLSKVDYPADSFTPIFDAKML